MLSVSNVAQFWKSLEFLQYIARFILPDKNCYLKVNFECLKLAELESSVIVTYLAGFGGGFQNSNKCSWILPDIKGLMKKNCHVKTGIALPRQINVKLEVDISGFFEVEFKREDSDPRLCTCTDRNFTILKSAIMLLLTASWLNRVTLYYVFLSRNFIRQNESWFLNYFKHSY